MTDHSSASIRPPKDWQDFERNIRVLFECILEDVTVESNGRLGQPQCGVDVFGRKEGKGADWFGIQCKGKDTVLGGSVSEKELRDEVEKARKFYPPLTKFILVTTAPDDVEIQRIARVITSEREEEGNPLSVSIWGWGQLEERISRHPKALEAFSPDASPYTDEMLSKLNDVLLVSEQTHELLSRNDSVSTQNPRLVDSDSNDLSLRDQGSSDIHFEIDNYRDLMQDGKSKTSLALLEKLKIRVWESASQEVKFRIVTNIGAAILRDQAENFEEASDNFIEAYEYQPDHPIANANLALAYLLISDNYSARRAAEHAISIDSTNASAASYLIKSQPDVDIDSLIDSLPAEVRESAEVLVTQIDRYRFENNNCWIELSLNARGLYPNNERITRHAAEATLQRSFMDGRHLGGQMVSAAPSELELAEAQKDLELMWDAQRMSESPSIDPSLPINLAQLCRVINDGGLARKVINQAAEIMPGDREIVRLQAKFCLESGDLERADQLLSQLDGDAESLLIRAEMKSFTDPDGALKLIGEVDLAVLRPDELITKSSLKVNCILASKIIDESDKIEAAEAEINLAKVIKQDSPVIFLVQAKLFDYIGADSERAACLNDAKLCLSENSDFYDRFLVAEALDYSQDYMGVANVLKGYVNYNIDGPALRTYFFALINGDKRAEAYEVLLQIPEEIREQPVYVKAEISLHLRRGDLEAARLANDRLMKMEPSSLRAHLTYFDILFRNRDQDAIDELLSSNVEALDGSPEERMRLSHILSRHGFTQRALLIGYTTLLETVNSASVQLAYIGLLLDPKLSGGVNFEQESVSNDSAFEIENEHGEKEVFIIEADENIREKLVEAISPDHTFAISALNQSVESTFELNGQDWKINWIKHKYLYIFQNRLYSYERRFPENNELTRIFTQVTEEGSADVEPILAKVKQRHDSTDFIFEKYSEANLPLDLFSKMLRGDIIKVWYGLQSSGRYLKVCHGAKNERELAAEAITNNNQAGCVVDALTLHILRTLDLVDIVKEVCGPIKTTQSAVDIYRIRLEEVESDRTQPAMTLSWQDGQFYRNEVTPDQLQASIEYHRDELNWIEDQIEILAAESLMPISEETIQIRDALSPDFLDQFLAAQNKNLMLLCEDRYKRELGSSGFDINCSWIQPVLSYALRERKVTEEVYSRGTIALIKCGHDFTSVDLTVLRCAFSFGENDFKTACGALFGANAELVSHARVMKSFFAEIWVNGIEPTAEEKSATSQLLSRLFFGEWRSNNGTPNAREIVYIYFQDMSTKKNFIDYLSGWLRGHFLLTTK